MNRLSPAGRRALIVEEGVRLRAYKDIAGIWTIGVGQTTIGGVPVKEGDELTQDQLDTILEARIQEFEKDINELVSVPINQDIFDALFLLAWNIGIGAFQNSTLLRKLNAGDYEGASAEFLRWNKITKNGEKIESDALSERRKRERRRFDDGVYTLKGTSDGVQEEKREAAPAQVTPQYDEFGRPMRGEDMSPIFAAVIPELLKILPWYSSGSPQAERNIKAVQQIAPVLIDAAKQATGQQGALEATEALKADKAAQQKYIQAVAPKWADMQPFLEFSEQTKDRAATRAQSDRLVGEMAPQLANRAFGLYLFGIFATAGLIGVQMYVSQDGKPMGELVALLIAQVTHIATKWGTIYDYRFGSSLGSALKDPPRN